MLSSRDSGCYLSFYKVHKSGFLCSSNGPKSDSFSNEKIHVMCLHSVTSKEKTFFSVINETFYRICVESNLSVSSKRKRIFIDSDRGWGLGTEWEMFVVLKRKNFLLSHLISKEMT